MEETIGNARKRILQISSIVFVALLVLAVCYIFSSNKTPAEAAKSVLYLEVYDIDDNLISTASGFLLNNRKTIVTNYHVIEDAYRITATTGDEKQKAEVRNVLAHSKEADLAILRCADKLKVSPLRLANSDRASQGDKVYAAGYPLGIANTLSDGIISSKYIREGISLLQTTAAVSHGSSGGALFNEDGRVVGVICSGYEDAQNINLAVSSNLIKKLQKSSSSSLSVKNFYEQVHPAASKSKYHVQVRAISMQSRETAVGIYNEWTNGEATEESLVKLMDKYAANQGGGKLYEIEKGFWVDEVDAWCFDKIRKIGDCEIIPNHLYGYAICYFSGIKDMLESSSKEDALVAVQRKFHPEETTGKSDEEVLKEYYEEEWQKYLDEHK